MLTRDYPLTSYRPLHIATSRTFYLFLTLSKVKLMTLKHIRIVPSQLPQWDCACFSFPPWIFLLCVCVLLLTLKGNFNWFSQQKVHLMSLLNSCSPRGWLWKHTWKENSWSFWWRKWWRVSTSLCSSADLKVISDFLISVRVFWASATKKVK